MLGDICSACLRIQLPVAWWMVTGSELVCVPQELTGVSKKKVKMGGSNPLVPRRGSGNIHLWEKPAWAKWETDVALFVGVHSWWRL